MKIAFVSLGCDKNLVDTEMMLGMLSEHGMSFTDDLDEADIAVVNTCCFIGDAKEESIRTLIEIGQRRVSGQLKGLIACGCLAQRYAEEIRKEIPEVDAVIGTNAIDAIVTATEEVLLKKRPTCLCSIDDAPVYGKKRILTTGGHYAYLKIAEGCEKNCTYCIIPKVRGRYRSVPEEVLVKEAEALVKDGVKELILVAQETTLYGTDLYGEKRLPELLRKLCRIGGLKWIRILYCYPEEITEELLSVIAEEEKVLPYLDIPIQHASDAILRRMGRATDNKKLREIIALVREKVPEICIRTTLITGFPGETEEDHEILMDFVYEMEFDRLGVFTYSAEEDTAAYDFPDHVPESVMKERQAQLMEMQQDIAFDKAAEMIGKELTVVVEGTVEEEEAYVGRTYKDAPDVDGLIFFRSDENLVTGDFVRVRVIASHEYDLIGELINEFAE